jgi:hypothetical protein
MSTSDPSDPKPQRRLNRRRFVQTSVAVGAPLILPAARGAATSTPSSTAASPAAATSAAAASKQLEAYAGAVSVKQGGSIDFFVRDPSGGVLLGKFQPLTITRMGVTDKQVFSTTVLVYFRSVPADASTKGCRWGLTYRLSVPSTWASGVYYATVGSGDTACLVPFVVRAATRTAAAKVLVQVPISTVQAYNNYGGKSLYDFNSTGGKATQVSFDRPLSDPKNNGFDGWTPPLVRWLESKGIVADYCCSVDLHADAKLLTGYSLFLTAGHDEYWSVPMRQNLDKFVANGGNAAILSGNTCWWQVRFDSTGRTMTCYKSRSADPIADASLKTINFQDLVPANPENTTTGLSYLRGGSWTNASARPQHPFVVKHPTHWAFAGLNFSQDTSFGGAYVGYETDAADFVVGADGRYFPTGLDGSPATLRILAQADASAWDAEAKALGLSGERSGYAAMAVFSRGGKQGTVFNVGTVDWVYGLKPELAGQAPTPISTITLNVIRKLSAAWTETAEVRRYVSSPASGAPTYFYTTDTKGPAGMTLDASAFAAMVQAGTGTTPVYRFFAPSSDPQAPKRYHYSTDPTTLTTFGWTADGVAFHAYAADGAGRRAVYQFRTQNALGETVLYFSTEITGLPGWVSDSPAFFVPVV